jgi:hypothetical protein
MEDRASSSSDGRDQAASTLLSLSSSTSDDARASASAVMANVVGSSDLQEKQTRDELSKDFTAVVEKHSIDAWMLTCPQDNLRKLTIFQTVAFAVRSQSSLLKQLPALVVGSSNSKTGSQSAPCDCVLTELGFSARDIAERFVKPLHESAFFNGGAAGAVFVNHALHFRVDRLRRQIAEFFVKQCLFLSKRSTGRWFGVANRCCFSSYGIRQRRTRIVRHGPSLHWRLL